MNHNNDVASLTAEKRKAEASEPRVAARDLTHRLGQEHQGVAQEGEGV